MKNLLNRIVLGTVQFGLPYGINNTKGMPDKPEVFEIFKTALTHGINKLDTADAYGIASNLIGEFHKSSENKFNVNTKFTVSKSNLDLEAQIENSLSNLNIACVEVYFFHSFTDLVENPNVLQQLIFFKKKGLIKKIGISIYDNREFEMAINQKEIDVIQIPYNVLDNINKRGSLLVRAKENKKIVHARSVFLQGLFFLDPSNLPLKLRPIKPYLKRFREISSYYSLSIEAACLAYVFSNTLIDEVILGVDNLNHLKANINIVKAINPLSDYAEFNKLFVREQELLYPKNW